MFEDLEGAVRHARACQAANPWHREAVALGALCLSRQARAFQTKGNTLKASQAYLEALGWAEEGVHQAQSDSRLHHAAITAGLGLAQLARSRGELAVATLDQLSVRAEQALELDPDGPVAQSDWLAVQCLKAMRQADLGQNPQQTLQGALAFYWTRTQEPRPPGLRAAHMVLYWLVALQDTARGQAPDNALAEALKGAGHTVADQRDYLEDLLQFKATQQEHANGGNRSTLRATGSPSAPAPTSTPSA